MVDWKKKSLQFWRIELWLFLVIFSADLLSWIFIQFLAHDTRYFDLLFAFHITKENFRQAAKSMYLHATRLKAEKDNVTSIQLRETALLTAINCLNLAQVCLKSVLSAQYFFRTK